MKRKERTGESADIDTIYWKGLLAGDSVASEQLYRIYYPLLYSYGLRMTGDKEGVTDAIQSLFVKLLSNRKQLPTPDNVKAYLLGAFRNLLLDHIEAAARVQCLSLEEGMWAMTDDWVESLFDKDDKDVQKEKKLAQAIARLSARQREILYLYYIKGLSHQDIAMILSVNLQSSKNLLSRTLILIRQYCLSVYTIFLFQRLICSARSVALEWVYG